MQAEDCRLLMIDYPGYFVIIRANERDYRKKANFITAAKL